MVWALGLGSTTVDVYLLCVSHRWFELSAIGCMAWLMLIVLLDDEVSDARSRVRGSGRRG